MFIGFIHLSLAILLCFISFEMGLYELISVAILFCSLARMDFCCLIIYLIQITVDFFVRGNFVGLFVQTGVLGEIFTNSALGGSFAITVFIALIIFYVIASIFCFFAYREFKHLSVSNGMGGFGLPGM